jgi:hypothetical protein
MNGFEEQGNNRPAGGWAGEPPEVQSLEEQLANAMARCEPPADFTKNVLACVAELDARSAQPWYARLWPNIAGKGFPLRPLRWAPALAAIVLLAGGMVYQEHVRTVEEHERTVEGLRAKEQLLEALRITNATLRETGARVAQVETKE